MSQNLVTRKQVANQRNIKLKKDIAESTTTNTNNLINNSDLDIKFKCMPINYCINITQDGFRNMDRASHLNQDEIDNKLLETRLRPISGIRNHIKRNLLSGQSKNNYDILKDSDLIQRIGSVKTLKRLDLSYNNLNSYPKLLCDLTLLEQLNLEGNRLQDLPIEFDRYQNLCQVILDFNAFKKIPKQLVKCKKIIKLSVASNSISDLKYIEHMKKLKYLTLNSNELIHFDDNLKSLEKLELLDLSHNKIELIQSNSFKSSFNYLKQLDLSFCRLQTIPGELFMLNSIEIINLSNNLIGKLPTIPSNYFRSTNQIFSIDLSQNQIVRFYDYLLTLANNIDLSANKIKTISSKSIEKFTHEELDEKVLNLDLNPLVDPPIELCQYGLKMIREYFDDVAKQIQLNKGFKIILLGDKNSGKTSLACALQDYNCQTNLIEQFFVDDNLTSTQNKPNNENHLIDIHEFFINNDINNSNNDLFQITSSSTNSFSDINEHAHFFKPVITARFLTCTKHQERPLHSSSKKKITIKSEEIMNLSFSEHNSMQSDSIVNKSRLQCTIYDLNGSLKHFGHLANLFLDKSALIIICLDSTLYSNDIDEHDSSLKEILDLILLKMGKNLSYYILPVLTKCDKLTSVNQKNLITNRIDLFIKNYIKSIIDDIKKELESIETQKNITASQSDRLKHLVQTQSNLQPEIYKTCLPISSFKMDGIKKLNKTIRDIVFNNQKYFPDVNKKVPAFWSEVEQFACTKLNTFKIRNSLNLLENSLSILCIDYEEYKEKIIEKYGMKHLIEQITKYMHSSGRILWFHDSPKLRSKVFLKPSLFYDLFFVLYRSNFDENFNDTHTNSVRIRLVKNASLLNQDYINRLKSDYLNKGQLNLDLLKLLWSPILMSDSTQLIIEIAVLFMDYFHIGYPVFSSKDKLRVLLRANSQDNNTNFNSSEFSVDNQNQERQRPSLTSSLNLKLNFQTMIIPYYLPYLEDENHIIIDRFKLLKKCAEAVSGAVILKLKKYKSDLLPKIALKYTFPWGLIPGIFERFSVNCLINSELVYKSHYRNYVYAENEENSIGVLIYTKSDSVDQTNKSNEIVFEFFLISYDIIALGLADKLAKNDEITEQTLTIDLDFLWTFALKIFILFEESITSSYPSLRFDRWSKCPECENFTMMGEFFTPKELQKSKSKVCPGCLKLIEEIGYLVKPTTGRSLNLDFQKMNQRLEKLSKTYSKHGSINTSLSKIELK